MYKIMAILLCLYFLVLFCEGTHKSFKRVKRGACSATCGGGVRQVDEYVPPPASNSHDCDSHYVSCLCGGYCSTGRKRRSYESCGQTCLNGYQFSGGKCLCPDWRKDKCCQGCTHINIPYCIPGRQGCGHSPSGDNIKCTRCENPYFSQGWGASSCHECPRIINCAMRHCSTPANVVCEQCLNDKTFFKVQDDEKHCERMCAWNNHYCWPGTCGNQLTKNCKCASGFRKIDSTTETSCQPSTPPTLLQCNTMVIGSDKKRTIPGECHDLKDFYGRFQPKTFQYELSSNFDIDVSSIAKPAFIKESNFGISDTTVRIIKETVTGTTSTLSVHKILEDISRSTKVVQPAFTNGTVDVSALKYHLQNGQRLCIQYEVKAGGYLRHIDLSSSSHIVSEAVPYQKTSAMRKLCYRYDNKSPEHCSEKEKTTCTFEPLGIHQDDITTRSAIVSITINGWKDPIPLNGNIEHASSIESYLITVHEVDSSSYIQKVAGKLQEIELNNTDTSLTLNLTSDIPKLYCTCINLEVKDVADNVRHARWFVLYDNTSFIKTRSGESFKVSSASVQTSNTWQTHHNAICLSWKKHFYNKVYLKPNFLNAIEKDPSDTAIKGVYDQTSGLLPVSGTTNVDGIIGFYFSSSLNHGPYDSEEAVPNFENQTFCKHINVTDGQTYALNIKAFDVMNNTYSDNRTIHIDRSVPHINNIWLIKDSYKRLFVHDGTDLSTMQLYFETLDPHSGIQTIEWTFGIADTGAELAHGSIGVNAIMNGTCPTDAEKCYCPNVGACELFNYTVPLNKLKVNNTDIGDHNRNYFFKLKTTNNALLSNTEMVDVLVDDSPPEQGVILEGPVGSIDIDYTSDDSIMVHWHGFIDHESGIKMYKIGMYERCLSLEELQQTQNATSLFQYQETYSTVRSIRLSANFIGKMFITIIALNNALAPSNVVCSDGITRDISPPELRNITLQHGSWSESIICHEGLTWLLHSSLTKLPLHSTATCLQVCNTTFNQHQISFVLPNNINDVKDEDISDFMCKTLPIYTTDVMIYIPNDHVYIQWDIEEQGSQIEDFYIGFGKDETENMAPGIMAYSTTNNKRYYKRRHTGIGSDTPFYIFIKSTNKAGLTKVTTLGPVLVDSTPPICKQVPNVHITSDDVLIGWENDTFYDIEQSAQINSILFQIEHDGTAVTPKLEWGLYSSRRCKEYNGGCFTYPLSKLQRKDTDLGLEFYIVLMVYNNAGHSITVQTNKFELPSKYPPGQAIVKDIDPDFINTTTLDVNVHFNESTLCGTWSGFKHHKNVTIEIGVGTNNSIDNVVGFRYTNKTQECMTSPNIKPRINYFFIVRATCSGGQTVSSSNGVAILTLRLFQTSFNVRVGYNCLSNHKSELLLHNSTDNGTLHTYTPSRDISVGLQYSLFLGNNVILNILSNDAKVSIGNDKLYGAVATIIPFVTRPTLTLLYNASTVNSSIALYECQNDKFIHSKTSLNTFWYNNVMYILPISYEAAIATRKGNSSSVLNSFETTDKNVSHTFNGLLLKPNMKYQIAIRPCSSLQCQSPVFSAEFEVDSSPPTGRITIAEMSIDSKNCYDLRLQWAKFDSDSGVVFYQWAISKDTDARNIISVWRTFIEKNNETIFSISDCIQLPVQPYHTMNTCVRAFATSGRSELVCKRLSIVSANPFQLDVVYDFDASLPTWSSIVKMLPSANIGDAYEMLHTAEIDFGTTNSSIAGAILYASEQNVTWSLMTSRHSPTDCFLDSECIESSTTTNGHVLFDRKLIIYNMVHYICAKSSVTDLTRELFTETLREINACSNGFVIDIKPPLAGKVYVDNANGYLTDAEEIYISWDGFDDGAEAINLGYVNGIKEYHFAIGTRQYGDDIRNFTNIGLQTNHLVRNVQIKDGSTIFISIKATDHAEMSTTVSSMSLLVDTTPPTEYQIELDLKNNLYLSSDKLSIHLTGFNDLHSGISHFEIGVGSHKDIDDMVATLKYYEEFVVINMENTNICDGHVYFVLVKAINRAGLSSELLSKSFILDRSPPTGGHVMDGNWKDKVDIDYQSDIRTIQGHWKGFTDPHSHIEYYRVGLGSRPYQDDVSALIDVGLQTDMNWTKSSSFISGHKYYITVEACNGADLCIKRSTNGILLDNTPPIVGIVRVGSEGSHQRYQPHNSSIHIRWSGFEDPHSSIDHFEVCIGTQPDTCDQLNYFNCFLQSSIIKTELNLPSNINLFASVKAVNKIGISVSQSSAAFRIDNTSPEVVERPTFVTTSTALGGRSNQWEKSVLRVSWKFQDSNSPITKHHVTLLTHHEGHTPIENIELGPETNLTINLDGNNWLFDGDRYRVKVTSCNEAGLCSTAQSSELLIDSSAPLVGGFKPPMSWQNIKVSSTKIQSKIIIKWYGFYDQESEIEFYYIGVGKSYSDYGLSDGIIKLLANNSLTEQSASVNLTEGILPDDIFILTIWAQNFIGLNSSVARTTVNALSKSKITHAFSDQNGVFEIQKHSCDINFCTECTCGVIGKSCNSATCTQLNSSDIDKQMYPSVIVFSGLKSSPEITSITPSSACLSGHWQVAKTFPNVTIQRYEWSIGLQNHTPGDGIFDLKVEKPWNDIGLRTELVYCLPRNKSLHNDTNYVIYVRVWYGNDISSVFASPPIKVDQSPPQIRKGKFIKDSDVTCLRDFDIIDWMHTITACWADVFSETQGDIIRYTIAVGTSLKADDVYHYTDVGMNTKFKFTNISLSHGTRYFITVTALNNVGLHTSLSSDGFVVDMDTPIVGVVFNTNKHRDEYFQASTTSIGFSWHGFIDHFSGIKHYLVTVIEEGQHLDNVTFANVGLQNQIIFNDLSLQHNKIYYSIIKAVDGAGHVSNEAKSAGKTIDTSPPRGYACSKYTVVSQMEHVLLHDGKLHNIFHEFEKDRLYKIVGKLSAFNANHKIRVGVGRFQEFVNVMIGNDGNWEFEYNFLSSINGTQNISIEDISVYNVALSVVFKECADMVVDDRLAVRVKQISPSKIEVNLQVLDTESEIYKVELGVGTTPMGFQVKSLLPIHRSRSGIIEVNVPHNSTIYVTVIAENYAGLRSTFRSKSLVMDHTPPVVANVKTIKDVEHTNMSLAMNRNLTAITTWTVDEKESSLKYCKCRIGTLPGASDIQSSWITQNHTSCESNVLLLTHGTTFYVSVSCVNNIELSAEETSEPVTVSMFGSSTDNAVLSFIRPDIDVVDKDNKNRYYIQNDSIFVQSNTSCIQLQWTGFDDDSGIVRYEYRLLDEQIPIVDWTDSAQRQMMIVNGIKLTTNQVYRVEVRAINTGEFISDVISGEVLVNSDVPKLTGSPADISRDVTSFTINWSPVFFTNVNINAHYRITVGSRAGYNDVLEIGNLELLSYAFSVPEVRTILTDITELYITIVCTYVTGQSTSYNTIYKL